jgi:hypothetical protein
VLGAVQSVDIVLATPVAAKVNATEVALVTPKLVVIVVAAMAETLDVKAPALAETATVVAVNQYKESTPLVRTVAVRVPVAISDRATKPILLATAVAVLSVTAIADADVSPGIPPFMVATPMLVGTPNRPAASVFATPTGARAVAVVGAEIATIIPLTNALTIVSGNFF